MHQPCREYPGRRSLEEYEAVTRNPCNLPGSHLAEAVGMVGNGVCDHEGVVLRVGRELLRDTVAETLRNLSLHLHVVGAELDLIGQAVVLRHRRPAPFRLGAGPECASECVEHLELGDDLLVAVLERQDLGTLAGIYGHGQFSGRDAVELVAERLYLGARRAGGDARRNCERYDRNDELFHFLSY